MVRALRCTSFPPHRHAASKHLNSGPAWAAPSTSSTATHDAITEVQPTRLLASRPAIAAVKSAEERQAAMHLADCRGQSVHLEFRLKRIACSLTCGHQWYHTDLLYSIVPEAQARCHGRSGCLDGPGNRDCEQLEQLYDLRDHRRLTTVACRAHG